MPTFTTNDSVRLSYEVYGSEDSTPLILIHGFTGSRQVWKRNIPGLETRYRVIVPDLRGHGASDKLEHGYHVSRLASDLHELILHLCLDQVGDIRAIGGSLGCSILWSYAELFTTRHFSHMVFVDQAPLQNSTLDGWDSTFCNRGMNNASAVAALQANLATVPVAVHRGTIAACLGYRSHPQDSDAVQAGSSEAEQDEQFFLHEAMRGDATWYGRLMADHTALDWRHSIPMTFAGSGASGLGSKTKVLVVASSRSGCFPSAGPMAVVEMVNRYSDPPLAQGTVVDWGGHWCYWEDPDKFNTLVLDFLGTS